MRRRNVLGAGAMLALGSAAGWVLWDNYQSDSAETTEPAGASSPEPPDEPEAEEVSFSIEPATNEIDWGEECSVTVSARAGDDPPRVPTIVVYETEDSSTWTGSIGATEMMWNLDAGESETETFEIEPPSVGEFTLGLMDAREEEVVDEWELMVNPPVQSFGETLSYYDGLDMTVDVELQEWIDVELVYGDINDEETGTFSVRPRDGQWVKVWVTAENTNTNEKVRMPGNDMFTGLADNSQLDHPRYLGEDVGAGTNYEIDDASVEEEGARMEMYHDGDPKQEDFWYPPSELISGAVEEGWMLFETDADMTVEDIQIRLSRNDVRATWR